MVLPRLVSLLQRIGNAPPARSFAKFARERPYVTSGSISSFNLVVADCFAQAVLSPEDPWDSRRTLAMGIWGVVWYGGPQQWMWISLFPRINGLVEGAALRAVAKMFADSTVNVCLALVPCYYLVTGTVRGKSLDDIQAQLKKEYFGACFGMVGFWMPVCFLNFFYVPKHFQAYIVSASLMIINTWLSWFSQSGKTKEVDDKTMDNTHSSSTA